MSKTVNIRRKSVQYFVCIHGDGQTNKQTNKLTNRHNKKHSLLCSLKLAINPMHARDEISISAKKHDSVHFISMHGPHYKHL